MPVAAPAPLAAPAAQPPTGLADQDWNMGPTTTTKDWGAEEGDWGSTEPVSCHRVGAHD